MARAQRKKAAIDLEPRREPMVQALSGARRSLTTTLVDQLRHSISSGELVAGDRLPTEKTLVSQWNVSRTVVREAVARLTAEGIVEPRQGSGVFVTARPNHPAFQVTAQEMEDLDDVAKLLELRLAVEAEMAGLAAERRTQADIAELRRCVAAIGEAMSKGEDALEADFSLHTAIATATGNRYFVRFLEFIGVRLIPPRSVLSSDREDAFRREDFARIQAEHDAIVDAIASGDARGARAAARNHLLRGLKRSRQVKQAVGVWTP